MENDKQVEDDTSISSRGENIQKRLENTDVISADFNEKLIINSDLPQAT